MKSVCIILPEETLGAVGGFKVAYIYANALIQRGYAVTLVYVSYFHKHYPKRYPFVTQVKKGIKYGIRRFFNTWHQKWFDLAPEISIKTVLKLTASSLPKADCYIATSVGSAISLNYIKKISPQRKYYLIQHYENWGGVPSDLVDETYRYPMNKICIAPWLVEKVEATGKKAALIPNGFKVEEFPLLNSIETRDPFSVAFMGARLEWKGVADTVAALEIVKASYPQLSVNAFGTSERPEWYPAWISYTRLPSHEQLVDIYNNAAIFVGASHVEGFGLTIGEAMCCGCAVACTDNGGFSVMVHHKRTGLLSPIKNPEALAKNIMVYLEQPEERIRLAQEGHRYIQEFTWESSVDRLVDFLERPLESEKA